jgi:lipoate-protein ligase A
MEPWTLLDTGRRSAAENIALDEAILRARSESLIPNTLRFMQFSPHAVLVGIHQNVEQEVRVDYCKERGIDICRRITGGGALYFDESQIGWEIIADKSSRQVPKKVERVYEAMCRGTIAGLNRLGVNAEFRPKNDIEVNGRKISGTGGCEDGSAFLFQGTLLVDFDVDTMLRALRIPTEKLKDKEIDSMKERVTCLKWELGHLPSEREIKAALKEGFEEVFDVAMVGRGLTESEMKYFNPVKFRSKKWTYGTRRPLECQQVLCSAHKTDGGLIRVSLVVDALVEQIKSVLITGDFFAYPKRTIFDLEARLKYSDARVVEKTIRDFFMEKKPQIPGIEPEDFIRAVQDALRKADYQKLGIAEPNSIFTVVRGWEEIKEPTLLLLPYCAKAPDCEYRQRKECEKCGECGVGEAYEIGERLGMEVTTIINYEDLEETLHAYKEKGTKAFIGSCCEAFYVKHQQDFERIGLPGILIDIDNQTCYDLGKEKEAYLGKFENQTQLKVELIRKVLSLKCQG